MICSAQSLSFEKTVIDVTIEPGVETTRLIFPFTNNTKQAVEIDKHQAPCSCISAQLKDNQKKYEPGAKGEMVANFNVGNLQGIVKKEIVIWIKDAPKDAQPIILTANITIPEIITITPRTQLWHTGSSPEPKTYKVSMTHKDPIHITEVVTTNDFFSVSLNTLRKGWEYEIVVTPKDTNNTNLGILKITTDSSISRYKRLNAFASIRPEE